MKLSFKQFLTESQPFNHVETAMELFDDEIRFEWRGKGFIEYSLTTEYWNKFTEEKLKKLQSYFGDDVYLSYSHATGHIKIYKAIAARVAGKYLGVAYIEDHVKAHEEVLDFIEQKGWHITEKELYCDREVANKINVTDEIFFLTDDGLLVLSGATSWSQTLMPHLITYKEFNKLEVGDIVYLFFDEEESNRIKRFKYLGTK